MAPDEEWITLAEAAKLSDHHPVSLQQAARRGALRATLIGAGNRATWYTTRDDLAAYLTGRRTWKHYRRGHDETEERDAHGVDRAANRPHGRESGGEEDHGR